MLIGRMDSKPDDAEAEKSFRRSVELDPTAYFVHISYTEALKYAPEEPEIRAPLQNQIALVSRESLAGVSPLRNPYLE
jgi:hypothetical protein